MYRNGGSSALLSADKQTYTVHEHSVTLKHSLIRPGSHRSLPVLFLPHWSPYYWTLQLFLFFGLPFPHQLLNGLICAMAFRVAFPVARVWNTFHSAALVSPLSLRIPCECLPGFSDQANVLILQHSEY